MRSPEKFWDKLETWHKGIVILAALASLVFGAGMATAKIRSSVVLAGEQHTVDERQDQAIHAVQDDAGRMHVQFDDIHDEVRGMRIDMRFFDPRLRGGGLPPLPEETPRPTATSDPSMGLPVATASAKPKGTP